MAPWMMEEMHSRPPTHEMIHNPCHGGAEKGKHPDRGFESQNMKGLEGYNWRSP